MGDVQVLAKPRIFGGENGHHPHGVQAEVSYLDSATAKDCVPVNRADYASSQIPLQQPKGNSSSRQVGGSCNHLKASGHHALHQLPIANVHMVLENHVHRASSSSTNVVVEINSSDLTVGSGRGPYKRKLPGVPPISEKHSAKGHYEVGSSSDASSYAGSQQKRPKVGLQHIGSGWEPVHLTPTLRSKHLPGEGESSMRNVRSSSSFGSEYDTCGSNRSGNHPIPMNSAVQSIDHSILFNHPHQVQTVPFTEMNPVVFPAVSSVRTMVPGTSNGRHELKLNQSFSGNYSNVSGQAIGYHHNLITSTHPSVPQSFATSLSQAARGGRTSYALRVNPSRTSVGNPPMGPVTPANPGLPLAADTHSLGHSRPSSRGGQVGNRTGGPGLNAELNQSSSVNAVIHGRLISAARRVVGRSPSNASRNLVDQHRGMRLNIDNMSYEELLALEERIGSVNTGVREDLLPKCLIDMMFYSPEPVKEEICTICLEEYQNMDDLAGIKACKHDFHVDCIKKWLSIKNLCPICKVAALPDNEK